jgi:hypothetical protein
MSVEQIRHRLSTKFKKPNQLDIRDDLDNGMEHILQISGGNSTSIPISAVQI